MTKESQQDDSLLDGGTDNGFEVGMTFDDLLLLPCKSDILPAEVNTQTRFSRNIEMNIPISLFNHHKLPDGRILLVGQGGFIFESIDNGDSFTILQRSGRFTITDIERLQDGNFLFSSDAGLSFQALPESTNSASHSNGVKL